jgi:hypothetical protein
MPYPAVHRARVKKNIIDSARKLFNRHGFENLSPSDHVRCGPDARRFLWLFQKQERSVFRGTGVLLHRPGVEKLLGRRARRPVIEFLEFEELIGGLLGRFHFYRSLHCFLL